MITFKDVWEIFRIKFIIDGKLSWDNFWALKDITFDVEKGQSLGIIGENGAGKSTILKLIAGILVPDRGEVSVSGRVTGLLDLGAGFQQELSGKDNIFLNSTFFGFTRQEIDQKYEDIENFAAIGKFINAPVKYYSQGMFVRLAFSIAICLDPEILLIDDTLAVGDESFQKKCIKKIFEIREKGATIVYVTHEMGMLQRLCKRAILLKEGRLIKDSEVKKTIALYTQVVGAKEGVGILKKDNLSIVFNNGRLFINWADQPITNSSGIHINFFTRDKRYNSFQAYWEIEEESDKRITAKGRIYQIELIVVWKIELMDSGEIKIDIGIESEQMMEIEQGCVDFILVDKYQQWFTSLGEKDNFPSIIEGNNQWMPLLEDNISRRCIGVITENSLAESMPSFIVEQSLSALPVYGQILNSDCFISSRILQFQIANVQNYSKNKGKRLTFFSGKIIIGIKDVPAYLKNIQDETTISQERLRLTFNNGKVIPFFNDLSLVKGNCVSFFLRCAGRVYNFESSFWEIKKEGNKKIIARCESAYLPVICIWEIEIISEDYFIFTLDIEIKDELEIEEKFIRIELSERYKYYFSKYGKGAFSDIFSEREEDMLQRCIPDESIILSSLDKHLPDILLDFSKKPHNFAKIFNSAMSCRTRVLSIQSVEPEDKRKFAQGRHRCFEVRISLKYDAKQQNTTNDSWMVAKKKLKYNLTNGRGEIFWNDKKLTKQLGFYTSLRSQGRWYDSCTHAVWSVQGNDSEINSIGRWMHLPIEQYWNLRLVREGVIAFSIKMRVNKEIGIDRQQTNIMLSEEYKQWAFNKNEGTFPLFDGNVDDDWGVISSCCLSEDNKFYAGVKRIRKKESYFPEIIFTPFFRSQQDKLNIVNTDLNFRGRVLQYLDDVPISLMPGEYIYSKGEIMVNGE